MNDSNFKKNDNTLNADAAESYFTQETVNSLGNAYPGKNRVVFHDQDSTFSLCTFYTFTGHFFWLTSFSVRRRSCTQGITPQLEQYSGL
jgi:hypothetical protein